MRKRALFCDRDGTLIVDRGYGVTVASMEWVPSALEAFEMLAEIQLPVIVVSNQSAIGRGLTSWNAVNLINARLATEMNRHGVEVLGTFVCPHLPEDHCACRKPRPGLLLKAAPIFDIELRESFMVGDKWSDLEAARNAGVRHMYLVNSEISLAAAVSRIKTSYKERYHRL